MYSEEVQEALARGGPVVALESTIITHGMPHPTNLAMATEVEDIIRSRGAVPATVAIIGGKVHVGVDRWAVGDVPTLARSQLEMLAECKAVKTSRRDFPYVLANRLHGGTTVSGTMLVGPCTWPT